MKSLRIAVIADDPPIKNEVLAWGLSRVNARLFKAFNKSITLVICSSGSNNYELKDILEDLKEKSLIWGRRGREYSFLKLFLPLTIITDIQFQLKKPKIIREIKKSKSNWIFCSCGIDPFSLWRSLRVSKKCKLPLAVYFVDDFSSGAELSGNIWNRFLSKYFVRKWMQSVDKVFVISEGLGKRFQDIYGIKSELLPLPYERDDFDNEIKDKNQIIFIGHLNHFYIDGVIDILKSIKKLIEQEKLEITVRFTLIDKYFIEKLTGIGEDFIISEPILDNRHLCDEIKSSVISFMPYSFDKKYEIMVKTSFPSKILDYLAYSKYIIVYGPEYSTSVQYFKKHGLKKIVSLHDENKLEKAIIDQLYSRHDESGKYLLILENIHSFENVCNIILNGLEGYNFEKN